MANINIDLKSRSYEVIIEDGILSRAASILDQNGISASKVAVISDKTVAALHSEVLIRSFGEKPPDLFTVAAGESSKSLTNVESLCSAMAEKGHDRKSVVIALGGGVVGDLGGLVAALFYRGIRFIQIPTTIVAQVDSSVGGKTGVNLREGKNLLGAFHQPSMVLIDPNVLSTLPEREYCEGFAEAIKHAAIRDPQMIDDLATLNPRTRDISAGLLARNIAIKARIIESDEFETEDIRALLNFGHTIGHGIEAALPYGEMLHGEAISLGMRAALYISERFASLPSQSASKIILLLRHFGLPLQLRDDIKTATILDKLARDKKFAEGKIRFIALREIGDPVILEDLNLDDLRKAIDHLRTPVCVLADL